MNQEVVPQAAPSQALPPAISPPVQAVLELFETEFAELKFPDIDLDVLKEAAHGVQERSEAVAQAEAALQKARDLLSESQESLLHKCQRALAYARVYAEDNTELVRRLEAMNLPRSSRGGRGALPLQSSPSEARPLARRVRRTNPPSGPLFLEPPAAVEEPNSHPEAA